LVRFDFVFHEICEGTEDGGGLFDVWEMPGLRDGPEDGPGERARQGSLVRRGDNPVLFSR
jgi:hypothetical protein